MKRILVSEHLPEEQLARLRSKHEVIYDPGLYADRPALLDQIPNADAIIIRNRTRIDADVLAAAGNLMVVGRLGVGLDNIDMTASAAAGVVVIPAVGANAVSVAEYVIGMMLILTRRVFGMSEEMASGAWPRRGHAFGRESMGQTLGVIGYGSIARQVAVRAAAFGMRIIACDPYVPGDDPAWQTVERTDLETLLKESDVVSIHAPLNDETHAMIGRPAFETMKPTAILINTARGGIVDEAALAQALRDGQIGGAAIDVFEAEPLEPGPASKFADLDNLYLTPHVAGNTEESVDRVARMIVDAVLDELGD